MYCEMLMTIALCSYGVELLSFGIMLSGKLTRAYCLKFESNCIAGCIDFKEINHCYARNEIQYTRCSLVSSVFVFFFFFRFGAYVTHKMCTLTFNESELIISFSLTQRSRTNTGDISRPTHRLNCFSRWLLFVQFVPFFNGKKLRIQWTFLFGP